jgi:hypothetical protein
MSLLNKASLIQIPSGYKDGTLYSAKPINGDGDFTFSRGSNLAATRVNSEGLIEKGRENLLLQSYTFDTTWTNTNSTETGGQSGYDGTNNAWLLESTSASGHIVQTISASGLQTYSVYAKAGTLNWIRILITASTGNEDRYFNLASGTIGGTTYGPLNSIITSEGNGWYRCSIVYNESTTGVRVYPTSADLDTSGLGNILIQDAQLEQGLVATDYIPTTTTTAQAGILEDMPRLDYSGGASCGSLLLEPQRTNINTQSEYFGASSWNKARMSITDNAVTSPEGVQNAANFVEDSTSNSHPLYDSFAVSSGTSYTVSMFAKKGSRDYFRFNAATSSAIAFFNLANGTVHSGTGIIEDFGNGWYRCSMTFTATSTSEDIYIEPSINGSSANYQGDGSVSISIYGFQLEQGSYPTSYIPTYGSSVTRGAEQYNKVITSLVPDATTFTWEVDFIVPEFASGGGEIFGRNAAGTTQLRLYANNNGIIRFRVESGGQNYDTAVSVGDTAKCIFRCSSGVVSAFYNGVKIHTFTGVTMDFGKIQFGTPVTSPKIIRSLVFPTALTDAECIKLTTI